MKVPTTWNGNTFAEKGFRKLRSILSLKIWFVARPIHQLSSDAKKLLLTGKIGKAYEVCKFFLTQSTKFPQYFQTWTPGTWPKLHFSTLHMRLAYPRLEPWPSWYCEMTERWTLRRDLTGCWGDCVKYHLQIILDLYSPGQLTRVCFHTSHLMPRAVAFPW